MLSTFNLLTYLIPASSSLGGTYYHPCFIGIQLRRREFAFCLKSIACQLVCFKPWPVFQSLNHYHCACTECLVWVFPPLCFYLDNFVIYIIACTHVAIYILYIVNVYFALKFSLPPSFSKMHGIIQNITKKKIKIGANLFILGEPTNSLVFFSIYI